MHIQQEEGAGKKVKIRGLYMYALNIISPAGEGSIENKPDVNTPACRRRRLNGGI